MKLLFLTIGFGHPDSHPTICTANVPHTDQSTQCTNRPDILCIPTHTTHVRRSYTERLLECYSFTEIKVCAGTANVDGGIETVTRKLTDISFNSHIAKDVEGDDSSSYGLEATDKHDTRATEEQQQPGSRQSQLQSPPPQNGATNLRGSRSSNLM